MTDQQNKIAILLFIVLGLLIVALAEAGTIPQYPPEDYVSGKAQAEIHERQMQEYERVLEMQRRQERQGYPADYYQAPQPPANNYDPRLWKNR